MRWSLIRWTLSFLSPYRLRIAAVCSLSVGEIGLATAAPWTLALIVDHVLIQDPLPAWAVDLLPGLADLDAVTLLVGLATAGLAMQLAGESLRIGHTQLQVDMGQRVVHDLRAGLLAHLQALPLRHHTTHRTSDSVYRLDADAYCVSDLVTGGVFPLAIAALTLTVIFAVLLAVDVTLALMTLGVAPFLYLCLRYHARTLVDRAEDVKTRESWLIERAYETLRAIAAIKSYARERHEHTRFVHASRETIDARLTLTWQESLFSGAVTTVTLAGSTLVLVTGGLQVIEGTLPIGTLLVVIAYMGALYDPISSIAHTIGSLQQALVSAGRVRDVLGLAPEVADPPGAHRGPIAGHVRFDDVGFSYDGRRPVLRGISFEVHPGELVAIVGLTGAGKTTLVTLIPRLFEPTAGRVLIDGIESTRYALRPLREQVALVPQTPILLAGTVADNIRFGDLDATAAAVEHAARAAHLHDFIVTLPRGYDTNIGENGATLSGGERQRLGLARAFLKDAPILILDEPTSAIDSIAETAVFDAVRRRRAGRTTLVIAHRLSTIRDATRIVVIHHGRLVASGPHARLLAEGGLYRRLWARLAGGRSLGDHASDEADVADPPVEVSR